MTKDLVNSCREGDLKSNLECSSSSFEGIFTFTDKPDPLDVKYYKKRNKDRTLYNTLTHYFNSHSFYCNLRKLGIGKNVAIFLCKIYEKNIYNGNGGSRLSKLLKTAKNSFFYEKN